MSCPPVRLCPSVWPLPTFLAWKRTLCTWVRAGKLRLGGWLVGQDRRVPTREEGAGLASSPLVCTGAVRGGLSWQSLRPLGWAEREGWRKGGREEGRKEEEWEGERSLEGQCNHGNSSESRRPNTVPGAWRSPSEIPAQLQARVGVLGEPRLPLASHPHGSQLGQVGAGKLAASSCHGDRAVGKPVSGEEREGGKEGEEAEARWGGRRKMET